MMRNLAGALVIVLLISTAAFAQGRRDRGPDKSPKVGDEAPNFKAKVVGKKATVELKKELKEGKKPIVLIFGSYT